MFLTQPFSPYWKLQSILYSLSLLLPMFASQLKEPMHACSHPLIINTDTFWYLHDYWQHNVRYIIFELTVTDHAFLQDIKLSYNNSLIVLPLMTEMNYYHKVNKSLSQSEFTRGTSLINHWLCLKMLSLMANTLHHPAFYIQAKFIVRFHSIEPARF